MFAYLCIRIIIIIIICRLLYLKIPVQRSCIRIIICSVKVTDSNDYELLVDTFSTVIKITIGMRRRRPTERSERIVCKWPFEIVSLELYLGLLTRKVIFLYTMFTIGTLFKTLLHSKMLLWL